MTTEALREEIKWICEKVHNHAVGHEAWVEQGQPGTYPFDPKNETTTLSAADAILSLIQQASPSLGWREMDRSPEMEDLLVKGARGQRAVAWFEDGSRPFKYGRGWHESATRRPLYFVPTGWLPLPDPDTGYPTPPPYGLEVNERAAEEPYEHDNLNHAFMVELATAIPALIERYRKMEAVVEAAELSRAADKWGANLDPSHMADRHQRRRALDDALSALQEGE